MTKLSEIIASLVKRENPFKGVPVTPTQTQPASPTRNDPPHIASTTEHPPAKDPSEIHITEEFRRAFILVEGKNPFVFVTGRAGTGKSTFTNLLKERLKSFAVVAPTGVAAFNVGGQTIHSFFHFAPGPLDLQKIVQVRNRIAYQALRTLIIDEISMVRVDLLDAIDKFLRENGPDRARPFGGVQIIAVGDLFQLPPIVATDDEQAYLSANYQTPFFFSAKSLETLDFKIIEFTRVFRQTEESFISVLNRIREGKCLDETLTELNSRVQPAAPGEQDCVVLTATNSVASRINGKRLNEIPVESLHYKGEVTGEIKLDQNKLPAPMELELKPGAQVMFVKNDRKRRWVNGTVGTVLECGQGYVNVSFLDRFGKHEVRVEPEIWENQKYEYNADLGEVSARKIGSYKQLPLTHAWAITIHKSQGKTFDRVHIDLERGAFAEGQVYVALSRCRTLEGVTLEHPLRREDIQLNYDVIQFGLKVNEAVESC